MIYKLINFDYKINNKENGLDEDFDYKIDIWYHFIIKNNDKIEIIYDLLKKTKIKNDYNIDNDILLLIYSTSILKCFENNFDKKENNLSYIDYIDSDTLINNIMKNINKYYIYIEICENREKIIKTDKLFCLNNQKHRKYIYKIIRFYLNSIIKSELVRIKNKTIYMYIIENLKNVKKKYYISKKPYDLIKIFNNNDFTMFQYSNHLSSLEDVFIKNPSNHSIFISNIEELYKKLQSIEIFYDLNFLKEILDMILYNFNINNKTNIKIEEIEKNYIEIKEILKNNFINNLEISSKLYEKMSFFNKLIDIKNISNLDILNTRIYLPFKFDFRGRYYYLTDLSPTFNWELRNCIYYGTYKNSENYLNSNIENIEQIEEILNKLWENNKNDIIKILPNIEIENKKIRECVIWILMSIGKLYIKTNNIKYIIKDQDFIKEGIKFFSENVEIDDIKKKIEIIYYKKILLEINNRIYKKRIVSKDATASVFQHLIKLCGYKNEESLKSVNILSDEWCDTYSKLIVIFISKIDIKELNNDELNNIFNRNTLKSTIMTEKYSAGLDKCYKYFNEKTNKITKNYNIIKKKEIKKIFIKFYYFLKKIDFFEKDLDDLKNYLKKENYNFNFKDAKINLLYKKSYLKQWEIKKDKKRIAKKYIKYTNEVDINETEVGSIANYIHAQDSAFCRKICIEYPVIAIHDCFLIDFLNITYFIALANKIFKEKFDEKIDTKKISNKIFNIFILI